MSYDDDELLRRIIGDDELAADVVAAIRSTDAATARSLLEHVAARARTTRERHLVPIAVALIEGDHDRFEALVRDHLADHPDHLLVAWIAANHPTPSREDHP